MAVVQTLHTMTKMYNVNVIQHSPQQQNCVIVSTGQPIANKTVIQGKRPLAPAPEKPVLGSNSQDVLRCKRKINFVPYGTAGHQPASVARRNARERNRVKQVNNGFATLRQHIPASVAAALAVPGAASTGRGASKKLSKVETLRMAVEYIRSLQKMLEEYEGETSNVAAEVLAGRYFTGSPDVSMGHHQMGVSHHQILQQTPPCSEASSSPTPSFSSESSVSAASSYAQTALYHTENYENYEPTSPEDEELLDAISWWQQQ